MPRLYTHCPELEHPLNYGWLQDHFCIRVAHMDGTTCSEIAMTREEATTLLTKLNPNLKEAHL